MIVVKAPEVTKNAYSFQKKEKKKKKSARAFNVSFKTIILINSSHIDRIGAKVKHFLSPTVVEYASRNITNRNHKSSTMECLSLTQDMRDSRGIFISHFFFKVQRGRTLTKIKKLRR